VHEPVGDSVTLRQKPKDKKRQLHHRESCPSKVTDHIPSRIKKIEDI